MEQAAMTARETFLQRVRTAVKAGQRGGAAPTLPERGSVGYQGAGPDPVARFVTECTAAGGQVSIVRDADAAASKVSEILRARSAQVIFLGVGQMLDSLGLAQSLPAHGYEVHALPGAQAREAWWAADAGITGVDYLVAETGSLAVLSRADEPRSLSLLPPMHIVVAHRRQIVPDLFDLFAALEAPAMPSCLSLITGPSKTGDIELKLVTGVHGPGEVHVIVMTDEAALSEPRTK
jgi:L-lactate utilization protein LutC